MTTTILALALALAATADKSDDKPARKPSAIAPSLKPLSRDEEKKLDDIVDRFILADTGKLAGAAKRQAEKDFDALGLDAVPALIRGLNRAAKINHSCPVLMISKKLNGLLMRSTDEKLLEFAYDEIGADVGPTRHATALKNLRTAVMLRKNAVARLGPRVPVARATTAELIKSAGAARGAALKGVVAELARREGKEALAALARLAASGDAETAKLGRAGLDAHLGQLSLSQVKEHLGHANAEVRRSAVRVASRSVELTLAVIDATADKDQAVRAEARAALKKLAKGEEDFGPADDASAAQQREARAKWRAWWLKEKE